MPRARTPNPPASPILRRPHLSRLPTSHSRSRCHRRPGGGFSAGFTPMLMLPNKLPEVIATPTTADGLIEDVDMDQVQPLARKTCGYVGGYGYYS